MDSLDKKQEKAEIKRSERSVPDEEVKLTKSMAQNTNEGLQKFSVQTSNHKTSNHEEEISSSSFDGSFGENVQLEEQPREDNQDGNDVLKPKKKFFKGLQGPEISLLDLSDKSLQAVYNEEEDELKIEFAILQKLNDNGKAFRYSLTM